MKRKRLTDYLTLIKSALDKDEWSKAKRLGEIVLKKLSTLVYAPFEEYLLYCRLGNAYYNLAKYSNSLDTFYKAYLIASKHHFKPADTVYPSLRIGHNFLFMRNINQALEQLHKVERYYQKYGDNTLPMGKLRYITTIIDLAHCYLYKNELEKVREIIEEKLSPYLPSLSNRFHLIDYHHLKGEYLMAVKEYDQARQSFQECIKISEQLDFPWGILEAKIHLATIDLLERHLEKAIQTLQDILKDARCLKLNSPICEATLLLSKCYSLKGFPDKAASMEDRIKPILSKLDIVWLYEKTREFESFFRQLQATSKSPSFPSDVTSQGTKGYYPKVLIRTLHHRYETSTYKDIIGKSIPMQEIYQLIEKIAPTGLPVLIQGETGTGKELIAYAIHHNSPRSSKSCLGFNSGAITETLLESELFGHTKGAFTGAIEDKKGYIELASGGTLFVDEIANMSPGMQQKLLRVLEEKLLWQVGAQNSIPIDTRFIFASNQDIEQMVKNKLFREDLFYRINTIVINLPPLRERKDDIPLLVQHFFRKYGNLKVSSTPPTSNVAETLRSPSLSTMEISPSALGLLINYPWPGNIRELENEIQRICVLHPDAKLIAEAMLSESIRKYIPTAVLSLRKDRTLKELTESFQRNIIIETLQKCNGNINQAAQYLGYSRRGLYKRMKQLKIATNSLGKEFC